MPGLRYLDSNTDDLNAIYSMGGTANSLATGLPQMRLNAQRWQQQMALSKAMEILRQAQTREANARVGQIQASEGLNWAKMSSEVDKNQREQNIATAAEALGRSKALAELFRRGGSFNNPVAVQSIYEAMQRGDLPKEGFTANTGELANAFEARGTGLAAQVAGTSPSAAAQLLVARNIPPGGIAANAFGPTGVVGQPKPIDVAPDHLAYLPPGLQPDFGGSDFLQGISRLSPGQQAFMPGEKTPFAQVAPKPGTGPLSSALDAAMFKFLPRPERERIAGERFSRTNNVPPPAARQVGQRITTAKGTFSWNGAGWDPVTQ